MKVLRNYSKLIYDDGDEDVLGVESKALRVLGKCFNAEPAGKCTNPKCFLREVLPKSRKEALQHSYKCIRAQRSKGHSVFKRAT